MTCSDGCNIFYETKLSLQINVPEMNMAFHIFSTPSLVQRFFLPVVLLPNVPTTLLLSFTKLYLPVPMRKDVPLWSMLKLTRARRRTFVQFVKILSRVILFLGLMYKMLAPE